MQHLAKQFVMSHYFRNRDTPAKLKERESAPNENARASLVVML